MAQERPVMDIGVVYYRIRPSGGEMEATWYSTRYPDEKCGTGLAKGDTSNGFPGEYRITYFFADGTLSAELDLRIEKSGDIYSLAYLENGETLLAGVGFETPEGLVAGYRKLD